MISNKTILIADDDRAIRVVLDRALTGAGYNVKVADNGSTLWDWITSGKGDVVITDVRMPDIDGLDLVPQIRQIRPELKIIVMSAQSTLLTAVKAMERGAYEYLPKPFDLNELLKIIKRSLSSQKHVKSKNDLNEDDQLPLIGRSSAMQEIYRTIARLMSSDLTVMIMGESGTGKELVARALHDFGLRKNSPFVPINMAAIPRDLIEAELFGHEKGAFTGATSSAAGRFHQARGGTLFLDEIGDMPYDAQTRLLRVLQEGEYTTVGGQTSIKADVRIISATHRDLGELIRGGQFREDLFYRLNVVPMKLPPLRDRREDIGDLSRHFAEKAAKPGVKLKTITPDGIKTLEKHNWPGNIRELENLVHRVTALYTESTIGSEIIQQELSQTHLPVKNDGKESETLFAIAESYFRKYFKSKRGSLPAAGFYYRTMNEIEKPLISLTLEATRGNQVKAADVLGLNRNTLRKKIRDLNIEVFKGKSID